MAKKATAAKLQDEIETAEELKIFLEKPGLLVLDIYSEWCGPCLGMIGILRRLKLEAGGDNLSCAICKADTIEDFRRFRRKSEPTWLFVTNYKAVNIMFGSDVPQLMALINTELKKISLKDRKYYDLNEYQPEELIRSQTKEEAINKASILEQEGKETKRLNYLTEVTDLIMDNLTDIGVTLFGPQVNRNIMKTILKKADQFKIQCWDRKTVVISRIDFETIHFNCPNPITDEVLQQLENMELFVCYWKVPADGADVPKILQDFAKELQAPPTRMSYTDNNEEIPTTPVLEPMEIKISLEFEDEFSQKSRTGEDTGEVLKVIEENINLQLEDKGHPGDVEESSIRKYKTNIIQIPAVWVPDNQRTHAALIYTYFRNQTLAFLPPDPIPEPPYVIMAFDAHKRKDLLSHAEHDRQNVPMYGFFTSDDAEEAKYIANSSIKYKPVTTNDKIVLKVQRATSRTVLSLVTYGPSYVSPNTSIGKEEVLKFFPPTYKTAEQEAQGPREL